MPRDLLGFGGFEMNDSCCPVEAFLWIHSSMLACQTFCTSRDARESKKPEGFLPNTQQHGVLLLDLSMKAEVTSLELAGGWNSVNL